MDTHILFVHGTFSSNQVWVQDEVTLLEDIKRSYPSAYIHLVGWSGRNTNEDRVSSAKGFADYVESNIDKDSIIYAIGHSHGGNVLLYSYKYFKDKKMFPVRVVCLGTPFFVYSRSNKKQFICILLVGIIMHWMKVIPGKFMNTTFFEFISEMLPFIVVYGAFHLLKVRFKKKINYLIEELNYDSEIGSPILNIQYVRDEVNRGFGCVSSILTFLVKTLNRFNDAFGLLPYILLGFLILLICMSEFGPLVLVILLVLFGLFVLVLGARMIAQRAFPLIFLVDLLKFYVFSFRWPNPLLSLFSKMQPMRKISSLFKNGVDKSISLPKHRKRIWLNHSNYYLDGDISDEVINFLK